MKYIGWIIFGLVLAFIFAIATADPQEALNDVFEQVAQDEIHQYEIAKKHGSQIDVCLRAQLVAESYLQANNEIYYSKWRSIQKAECSKAGLDF